MFAKTILLVVGILDITELESASNWLMTSRASWHYFWNMLIISAVEEGDGFLFDKERRGYARISSESCITLSHVV